jgi:hypothetical protein
MAKSCPDGLDHEGAQARDAEEALEHQAAQEHVGQVAAGAGDDGDQRVAQHVAEQHHRLRQALGARGAHVVLADLLEEHRAVQPRLAAQPRQQRQQDRQHEELDRVQPRRVAEIGTSRSTRENRYWPTMM